MDALAVDNQPSRRFVPSSACFLSNRFQPNGDLRDCVLPLQVEAKRDPRVVVRYESAAEVRREMEARGMTKEWLREVADSFEVDDKVQ